MTSQQCGRSGHRVPRQAEKGGVGASQGKPGGLPGGEDMLSSILSMGRRLPRRGSPGRISHVEHGGSQTQAVISCVPASSLAQAPALPERCPSSHIILTCKEVMRCRCGYYHCCSSCCHMFQELQGAQCSWSTGCEAKGGPRGRRNVDAG